MHPQLKEIFTKVSPVTEKALSELESIFKYVTYSKNETFITIGNKNVSEYIVLDGFCRSFLQNPDGYENTLSFYKKNDVLSPHIIRTKNDISLLNFQALTELRLVEFDAKAFLNLMIENMEIRNFGNTILLNELVRKTEKEIAFASKTAADRMEAFRKEYGILENLVSHPVIASYLGITNVSFSRLRGKSK